MKKWKRLHRIVKLKSPWVTVFADKLLDNEGRELEYWHYERPDSVIVVVTQSENLILPPKEYRVGLDKVTLDFVGGRLKPGRTPQSTAYELLKAELNLDKESVASLKPINKTPLAVDSSFSTQNLYGYIAEVSKDFEFKKPVLTFSLNEIDKLRKELHCAQCRVLLQDYLIQSF